MEQILAGVDRCGVRTLARLMELGEDPRCHVECHLPEMAAMFRHQMSASMASDLRALSPPLEGKWRRLKAAEPSAHRTFGELFGEGPVPIPLLALIAEFAKANQAEANGPMPVALAKVLYYTCLAKALAQGRQRISQEDDQAIARGVEWVLGLSWVDETTKRICRQALSALRPSLPPGAGVRGCAASATVRI